MSIIIDDNAIAPSFAIQGRHEASRNRLADVKRSVCPRACRMASRWTSNTPPFLARTVAPDVLERTTP